ncbi:hypothetical protein [Psychrobacillus antarcticus]|uniref:hypothetical protein n=1 Tax=Psychrobacillus antarcticus TaxID=2879115 RepID=UPI00240827D9|nr:hypothetical protein [Psychrobacillus antarcticus]
MKESKVHLVSAALAKNYNKNHFHSNYFLEFLEEQKSVNHRIMNTVSQLDQSCKTILSDLRNQNQELNKLNNNHKYDYVNLKKILFNLAQTTRGYGSHLLKQENTLQVINEQLDHQSKFNAVASKRAADHDKVLNHLQGSLNRQRNFLNNFAINQNSSFENIKHQLDSQEEVNGQLQNRLDIQKDCIQNVLEEQKRIFTIVSDYSEEKNHFHKKSSEKSQLAEEMDELILEEIQLQIIQQDDIYNYLQDTLNRQQGFLLQLSDNQNRQLEKITKNLESHHALNKKSIDKQDSLIQLNEQMLDNINKQYDQHKESLKEVKELIEKTLYLKGNIGL